MDEEEQVAKNDDLGWEDDGKKGKKGKKGGKGKGKKGGKDSDDDFVSKTQESKTIGKQQEEVHKEEEVETKKEEKVNTETSTLHFAGCSIEILQQAIKLEVDEDGNPIAKNNSSVSANDVTNPSP